MDFDCRHFDAALRQGEEGTRRALLEHAGVCPECRERLRIWDEISALAPSLHKEWESPDLWFRIHQSLAAESQKVQVRTRGGRGFFLRARQWIPAAALLALAVIPLAWVLLHSLEAPPALKRNTPADAGRRLLSEQALREIEQSEAAYVRAIDKLADLARPRLEESDSSLMLSFRERLMVIDESIRECQRNIELNPFNAHLRRELLAMYQEKQRSLEELTGDQFNERR